MLKKAYFLYLFLLVVGFIYVKNVLEREDVDVRDIPVDPIVFEIKDVDVVLRFENGAKVESYPYKLKNTDTVESLLGAARKDNKIRYEKVEYSDKIEILLNNFPAPTNMLWRIFLGDKDVTDTFAELNLEDSKSYVLKLAATRSAEPQ